MPMTCPQRWLALAACILLALPLTAMAQDTSSSDDTSDTGGWHGSGEFGFAMTRGNSHTENLNAKLSLKQETARWKNSFYLTGLRSKGDRSEEHTSELQSRGHLVCRLLLEKK